jgi:hypothetical protein
MKSYVHPRLAVSTLPKLGRWTRGMTARSFPTVSDPQQNHNFISRRLVMKRITILLFLSVFSFSTAMQAQAPAPKPDPEMKKLSVFVGHWTLDGEYKPGPLGPGGKYTGEMACQMVLGGSFMQCRLTEKGLAGASHYLVLSGYDSVNKNFATEWYFDDGSRAVGAISMAGNTWNFAAKKWAAAGKQIPFKSTFTLAPDLASATQTSEISVDGTTWAPWFETKYTKVPPAAKK